VFKNTWVRGRIRAIILLSKKNCGIPYSFLPSLDEVRTFVVSIKLHWSKIKSCTNKVKYMKPSKLKHRHQICSAGADDLLTAWTWEQFEV
jgi:hypothetical protein